jgi:hypothetical protein
MVMWWLSAMSTFMKNTLHFLGILVFLSILIKPDLALAESGLPDSAEFGYGVHLDLAGTQINPSIAAAASLKINWLALDFDWSSIWPERDASPDLDALNQAIYLAQQNKLSVMVSIARPPAWVVSPEGPDPAITAKVVQYLARTYPGVVLAIELFPGANTILGWGTTPNPIAYLNLLKASSQALQSIGSSTIIIAAGLTPSPQSALTSDMDDLAFLEALYNAGALPWMPIVGLRMVETTGDPLFTPTTEENRCLRHFEEVRQVMLAHNHREGLIWLTSFTWPSGNIQASDKIYKNTSEQTRWLSQSYQILKAQLYLGVAFFSQINPPKPGADLSNPVSLVRPDLSYHPALASLGLLISPPADNTKQSVQIVLVKRIVQEVQFKPSTHAATIGQ